MVKDDVGFGCASLLGRYGKRDSINILESAYSQGIRHYDVARSYGYGEAESLLGKVLSGKSDLKVSTKFGILPTRKAKLFSFAKPFVRPFVKKKVPESLEVSSDNGNIIDEGLLRQSVEESLRALNVDRLHRLFVHDPGKEWRLSDSLFDALQLLHNSDVIENWGVSAYLNSVSDMSQLTMAGRIPCYQSSMTVLDDFQHENMPIESVFSPFHRGYVTNALERLCLNSEFCRSFEEMVGYNYKIKSPSFWAVAVLAPIVGVRIVFATRDAALLDENIQAVEFGQSLGMERSQRAAMLIRRYVNS